MHRDGGRAQGRHRPPAQPEQRYRQSGQRVRGPDDLGGAEPVDQAARERRDDTRRQPEEAEQTGRRGGHAVPLVPREQQGERGPQGAPGAVHAGLAHARAPQVGGAAHHARYRDEPGEQRAPPLPPLHGQDVRRRQPQYGGQDGGAHEHRAPAEGLPGEAAEHPGRDDAGEQARDDGGDVPGPAVGGGTLGDQRDEQLRYDGRGRGDQHGPRKRAGPGRPGGGEQGGRGDQREDGDQAAPVHAVTERGEEEQAGRVAQLGDRGEPGDRRRGRAHVVGDEGQQRRREVDVGGRDRGAQGDQGEEEPGGGRGGSGPARAAAGRGSCCGPAPGSRFGPGRCGCGGGRR
ncbi:hypothetical protein STENM223S_03945 [Streptomyces tendae]